MMLRTRTPLLAALALAATAVGAQAQTTHIVDQVNLTFQPADITIAVGDTVRWVWSGGDHDVTEGNDGTVDGNEAFFGLLDANNQVYEVTFDQALLNSFPVPNNVYDYFCSPHFFLGMVGTITVVDEPGTAVCFGDGSGGSCACANNGGAGEGCANSSGSGAVLSGSGNPSLSADTLVFEASQTTNQPGIFFQGTNTIASPPTFGDGVRCCGGSVARLVTIFAQGNCASTDQPSGCGNQVGGIGGSVSQHPMNAGLQAGDTRCYQWWYRDPGNNNPCQLEFFNLSSAYEVTWGA